MVQAPFPAYQGDEAYVFVCYSHADAERVYGDLRWLHERGYKIWYDEGISPGSFWREETAGAIERASVFLLYISPATVDSPHCMREVNFALDENLPFVSVHLETTRLPAGLRLAVMDRQGIVAIGPSRAEYEAKLCGALERALNKVHPPVSPLERLQSLNAVKSRVSVCVVSTGADAVSTELVGGLVRYISWHGGAFRAVGRLHADYLVEIGTHLVSETTHISWQVQRSQTTEVIWANRYSESPATVADKQDRIAEMIAEGAISKISDYELHRIARLETDELTYGQLVLRAEQLNYLDRDSVAKRQRQLSAAIDLEPTTGLAHALLADLLSWKVINGVADDPNGDRKLLLLSAQTALQFDANSPEVLLSVGLTYSRMREHQKGLALIRRSYALAPTVRAKDELARSLCFAGQPDEAIGLFEQILNTMPAGHLFPYGRLAVALTQAGRLPEALDYSTQAVTHFPKDYYGWLVHANLLAQFDRMEEARTAYTEAEGLVSNLRLDKVIALTEASYGRTEPQKSRLTGGWKRLQSPLSSPLE